MIDEFKTLESKLRRPTAATSAREARLRLIIETPQTVISTIDIEIKIKTRSGNASGGVFQIERDPPAGSASRIDGGSRSLEIIAEIFEEALDLAKVPAEALADLSEAVTLLLE